MNRTLKLFFLLMALVGALVLATGCAVPASGAGIGRPADAPSAKTHITLVWDWEFPMPQPGYVFQLFSTTNMADPQFRLRAEADAPPIILPMVEQEFFIIRWTNVVLGIASEWNTK